MKKKLLIIEDDKHFAGYLAELLSGHEIQTAVDGIYGLKIAKLQRPDLIIIDLGLPRMSGQELMGKLKEDPALKSIPLILVSGGLAEKYEGEAVPGYPAEAVFTKPFEPDLFQKRISEILLAPQA